MNINTQIAHLGIMLGVLAMPGYVQAQEQRIVLEGAACEKWPEAPSMPASTPVDFSRELVITNLDWVLNSDNAGKQGPWHFHNVLSKLTGIPVGQGLTDYFNEWVNINFDTTRHDAAVALKEAWAGHTIDIIAIVNRLDLADLPKQSLGEGRLVYELRREVKAEDGSKDVANSKPVYSIEKFTLIMEFSLPAISGDLEADLQSWARYWHALNGANLSDKDYSDGLARLTAKFVCADRLERIRTNESASESAYPDGEWEMRQFEAATGNTLAPAELTKTPDDSFKAGDALSMFVYGNMGMINTKGEYDFADAASPYVIGLGKAGRYGEDAGSWTRKTADLTAFAMAQNPSVAPRDFERAFSTVVFNTCAGCHHEFNGGGNRHIFRMNDGEAPQFSRFFTEKRDFGFSLPGCEERAPESWCAEPNLSGSATLWDEKFRRTVGMECLLSTPRCPVAVGPEPGTQLSAPNSESAVVESAVVKSAVVESATGTTTRTTTRASAGYRYH